MGNPRNAVLSLKRINQEGFHQIRACHPCTAFPRVHRNSTATHRLVQLCQLRRGKRRRVETVETCNCEFHQALAAAKERLKAWIDAESEIVVECRVICGGVTENLQISLPRQTLLEDFKRSVVKATKLSLSPRSEQCGEKAARLMAKEDVTVVLGDTSIVDAAVTEALESNMEAAWIQESGAVVTVEIGDSLREKVRTTEEETATREDRCRARKQHGEDYDSWKPAFWANPWPALGTTQTTTA